MDVEQKQFHAFDLKLYFTQAIINLRTAMILLIIGNCISIIFSILKQVNFDVVFYIWLIEVDIGTLLSGIFFLIGFILFFRSTRKLAYIYQPIKNNIINLIQKMIIGFIILFIVEYILLFIASEIPQEITDYIALGFSIIYEIITITIFISLSIFYRNSKSINGMNSRLLILPFVGIPFILFKILTSIFLLIFDTTLMQYIDFSAILGYDFVYVFIYLEIIFVIAKINAEQVLISLYPQLRRT